MSAPINEPPVPADGLCFVCRQPREPERSARYAKAEALKDPFCSTECCREWWRVRRQSDTKLTRG